MLNKKKLYILILTLLVAVSCSDTTNSHLKLRNSGIPIGLDPTPEPTPSIDDIVSNFIYPKSNSLMYEGELIADLDLNDPVTSQYGSVQKGQTLNYIKVSDIDFLVYGEDGVSAAQCEGPTVDFPDHGPGNILCQNIGAENYNKIILCTNSNKEASLAFAQEWTGLLDFMTDEFKGMICWVNGTKMISNKIFTY